jgi:CBS domain-containing protein/anti-sigma regulatory factor (Ser/Thr protein kinase)
MKPVEDYIRTALEDVPNMKLKSDSLPTKIQELAYRFKVKEAMTRDVITVKPGDKMKAVRKILQSQRISGLPVVKKKRLAGIMSMDNFINSIINGGIGLDERVENYMTEEVEVVYTDEPLVHAISKFDQLGYGRFPVLDRDTGILEGIVTKGDIIKCLLKKLEFDFHEEEIPKYRASHIFEDIHSDKTTLILRYRIKGGDFKRAGEQSGFLKVNLSRLGIPPQAIRRAIVASCEAEMNIIIFTDGGELVAFIEEDRVRINAIDKGPGIVDVKKAMQPGYSTAPDWVREMGFGAGMGLPNIENCSDEMHINTAPDTGTKLEFTIFLEK